MANHLFENYKNSVMLHGCLIYATEADMGMATMCAYPSSQHAFPHCKCGLHCCANFPPIGILYQESDRHRYNTSPSIHFHIYHLIARFTVHGRLPLDEKKIFCLCLKYPATVSLG